ncbi:hypothetical protein BCR44DRAFT_1423049 [Catenaria anguillulae PL171]|uniref:Uncharacterized protein n=1 Tax=Catenaria anguillulae PL171 TaxID=765915 RepID=A0A1Y2I691_9FUNG|nr:hypothetical protein BCR44DRAFT_1423049 [Catenaria anguillulae PL171]
MRSISLLLVLAFSAVLSSATPVELHKRRFGQENPAVLNEIRALSRLPGVPPDGRFDQIAGIITRCKQFGCEQQGVAVARKLAALEKNFNPFAGANAKPAFCGNPAVPASAEIKCIVPVIDPSVQGAADFNTKAQDLLRRAEAGQLNAQQCAGKSVRQQAIDLGLRECVGCDGAGATPPPANGQTPPANPPPQQGGGGGNNNNNNNNNNNKPPPTGTCPPPSTVTVTVTVTAGAGNNAPAPTQPPQMGGGRGNMGNGNGNGNGNGRGNGNNGGNNAGAGGNLQTFPGGILGVVPPQVRNVGGARPFQVILANGQLNGDFVNLGAALNRSCDVFKNLCANVVNSGVGRAQGVSVGDCDAENAKCKAAIRA